MCSAFPQNLILSLRLLQLSLGRMADFSDEMADRVRKQESERFLMSVSLLLSLSVFDLFEHGCFFAS